MKPVSTPVGPILIGAVLLAAGMFFLASIVTPVSGWSARALIDGAFLLIILFGFGGLLLAIGVSQIGPRRRYLAATTPEQRAAVRAAARSDIGGPVDYGTRVDDEAPR